VDDNTFDQILDSISQGVVLFGADRKISYCNQAFLDITGFDRGDVAGALCHIMQGPDTDPATIAAIDAALRDGVEFSGEILNYRKSGETFWNQLTFKPEFNADGSVHHFIGISRDITREKTAEIKAAQFQNESFQKSNELELLSGHLSSAQRIAKIGIFDYSVRDDLQYWSDELINMIAAPRDEFPAPSDLFVSRIDRSDRPKFDDLFYAAVQKGIPYEITVKVHRYTGGTMYMQIIADVRDVGDDRRISGIARDVTEETTAALSLAHEKERFELAARATQDAIFEWNLETHEFWANAAYEVIYGYKPPSHVDLNALEKMADLKADADFTRRMTQEAIDSQDDRYSIEYSFTRPEGTLGHAVVRGFIVRDERGKAVRIIGTSTDVGRLTETMAALEESEERFRIIADTVSDVLWDRNFDTGDLWVTPDWPERLRVAIDPSLNIQDFLLKHVHPDSRNQLDESFRQALKSNVDEWETQYGLIDSDGQRIDLAVKAAVMRRPDGRVYRMLGNARNVTIERRQQEGYTRARALEAVGQLTGGVAHDFNNQLMIIQGNAELLEMSELNEEQAESVALISQAASSSVDLTKRLLFFSSQSQLKTSCVDLTKLIPNTVALLRAGIPESITIGCALPSGMWQTRADANALEQAIVNLALNARDAMPDGGDIIIACENKTIFENKEPLSLAVEPGDYVVISVNDNGEGMLPEVLSKAFEPFFTTKDVGKGTGLGLSTVYGFAKQSGGHVTISSEPGEGTTIHLFLPRVHEADEAEAAASSSEEAQPDTGQRILLVEDEGEVRAHVEKLLIKLGYVVTSAANGQDALSLMRRGSQFDLLFTDVIMPCGMNGPQLAEQIKMVDPGMKVLFTSGYPASAFEHFGLDERDHIRILTKPYRLADLKAALAATFES